jgi:outer membrane protein assembly factor BamB
MLDPNRPLFIATNGYVCSLDPATGGEHWRIKLPESRGSLVSLMHSDGLVFAGCGGRVYAIDPVDGKILWFNSLPGTGYQPVVLAREGAVSDQETVMAGLMAAEAAAAAGAAGATAAG